MSIVIRIAITTVAAVGGEGGTFHPAELYCVVMGDV